MASRRILILGGGFAGVKCARTLRTLLPRNEFEIVVFNRENHMVFHPLLAEVASAAVQPKDVGAPLRQLLHGVQCRTEEVLNICLDDNAVEYEAYDGTKRRMQYDQLVIACGSTVNLGLIPGMDDHAFSLKTIGDALALQAHVMEQMEKAEVCESVERRRWYLTFVVVGGGFSGVEVAGEINDLVRKSRKFFSNIKANDICVTVVHSRDQILPEVNPSLRDFAKKAMEKNGVEFILNVCATRCTPEGVQLNDGRFIDGSTVVCTIGNSTLPIITRLNVQKENGRLVTNPDMSLANYDNVWAIGDCAAIINAVDNRLCPPVGQFAERQGKQVAHNVAHRLHGKPTHPFSYKMMGQLCSIGGHSAVAEMLGLRLSGFPAWFAWRGIYLMKLPSLAQQAKVGLEWMCDLIFPRTLAHIKADRTKRICRALYAPGDYVFHQGDPATDFYVIEQGEVEVVKDCEVVAVLGPGDFFGESALIDSRPRNAAVRARTEVEVTLLGRNVFTQISAALHPLRDAVATAVKRRTNVLKNLGDLRAILDEIPLEEALEPLPAQPLRESDSLEDAVDRINKYRLDFCCVVCKKGLLTGIVSRSDLLRAIEVAAAAPAGSRPEICVKDIMVEEPLAITASDTTTLAVLMMREHGLKKLPVVESCENRKIKGYVRIENIMDRCMKAMSKRDLEAAQMDAVHQ